MRRIRLCSLTLATGLGLVAWTGMAEAQPLEPGRVTVSLSGSGALETIVITGQLGLDVAVGLSPWAEAALQIQPLTWMGGVANAGPDKFPQVDAALSCRMFPWGADHLWYVAPVLRGGIMQNAFFLGPGVEAGLEGRLSGPWVGAIGIEAMPLFVLTHSTGLRVGLTSRLGYRF
jgi:hypothetical protein